MITPYFKSIADKMKIVKDIWSEAPPGPKKDAAMVHFMAAEQARREKNDADCVRLLQAACQVLA